MDSVLDHSGAPVRPARPLFVWVGTALFFLMVSCQPNLKDNKDFTELEFRVTQLEGYVANETAILKQDIQEIKTTVGIGPPPELTPSGGQVTPSGEVKSQYNRARNLFVGKKYNDAAQIFSQIAEGAPRHPLAPNARYWLGECYYSQGQYQRAIVEFDRVVADYPTSQKAPDATLKLAYSYDRLKDGNTAMAKLRELLRRWPKSNAARMVKSRQTVF